MPNIRNIFDGLVNMASGRGTSVDKRAYGSYAFRPLTQQEIAARYRSSWLARKIVDIPADDMTREGRDWQAEKDQIEKLEAEDRRLQIWRKVRQAIVLGRLGGGALLMGVGGEDPALPINPRTLRAGSLRYLHVLSRWQLSLGEQVSDPQDEFFGQPSYFEINGNGRQVRIHPSRVIAFPGQAVPDLGLANLSDWFWGDSVYQSVDDAVKNADAAQGGFASLIEEAKIDIIRIPGLTSNFASAGYEDLLMKRLGAANTLKSLHNALLLDGGNGTEGSGEEWEQKQINWAGMPDIIKVYLAIVAGAADIPATRLLGKSPDGMNATGDGDESNYFQMIGARQTLDLRPALDRLDAVLLPSALGKTDPNVYYEFAPLMVLGEKDRSEIENKNADTVSKLVNSGVVPIDALATAVQNRMVESGQWPGLEAALEEADPIEAPDPDEVDPSKLVAANENGVREMRQRGQITADQALALLTDAAPRTLYVSRKLVNAAEFIEWAKGQGFDTTTPADELHVTIAFSRTPVDWMKMGSTWSGDDKGQLTIAPGGARIVEPLGDKGAVVLLFNSSDLSWRHADMKRHGASFDFDEYQPHVTITYQAPAGLDLRKVEPYRGKLVFGPEIFAEVVDDWEKSVTET